MISRRSLGTAALLIAAAFVGGACTLAFPGWFEGQAAIDGPRYVAGDGEPVDFRVVPAPETTPRPFAPISPADREALGLGPEDGLPPEGPAPSDYPEAPVEPGSAESTPSPTSTGAPEPTHSPEPAAHAPLPEPEMGGFRIDPRTDVCAQSPQLPGCPVGLPALVVELIERIDCPDRPVGDEIVICEVTADPAPESAEISWRSDRPTIGSVLISRPPLDLTDGSARSVRDRDQAGDVCGQQHSLTVDRLDPDTEYEFEISARPCDGGQSEPSDIHRFRTTLGEAAAITVIWVDDRLANRVQVLWQASPDAPSEVIYWEQGGPLERLTPLRAEGDDIGALGDERVRSAFLPTRAATAYWFQVSALHQGTPSVSEIGSFTTPGGVVDFQLEPVTIFEPDYVTDRFGQYNLQPGQVAHLHHWCLSSEHHLNAHDPPYWCQIAPGNELVGGVDPPDHDPDVSVLCRDLIEFIGLCVWRERLGSGPTEPDTCVGVQVRYAIEDVERLGTLRLRAVPTNLGHDVQTNAQLEMELGGAEHGDVTLGCLTDGLAYDVFLDAIGLHRQPVVQVSLRGADRCCEAFPGTSGRGGTFHPHAVVSVPSLEIVEAAPDVGSEIRLVLTVTDDQDRELCRREDRLRDAVGRELTPHLDCDIPIVGGADLHVDLSVYGERGQDAHEEWTFAVPRYDSVDTLADAGRLINLETSPQDGFILDLWLALRWQAGVD